MAKLKLDSAKDCTVLRAKLEVALEGLAKDLGIDLHVGRMTYGSGRTTVKLECNALTSDGSFESNDQKDLREWMEQGLLSPLEKSDIGREFVCKRRTFILEGYSPRSPKRPFICRDKESGKRFKFEEKTLHRLLGKKSPSVEELLSQLK